VSAAVDELLERMGAAGRAGTDLIEALRESPTGLCRRVAERLEAGVSLPQALEDVLPAAQCRFFAGPRPGLAEAVVLVDQERRQQRAALGCRIDSLIYPVLCLLVLVAVTGRLVGVRQLSIGWGWGLTAGALVLAALAVLVAPLALPPLHWAGHLRRAQRFAQAALVARWRLNEHEARRCFGATVDPLLPLCGQRHADEHLAALASHHLAAARRAARRQAALAALLAFAAAATLGIAVASSIWSELIHVLERSAAEL